jgi:hypothetical protein
MARAWHRDMSGTDGACDSATIEAMAETTVSLNEQLEEIGARLAWVRDYL